MTKQPHRHPIFHAVRIVSGWIMIVLGLAGLFLPFLQGVLFLAIGALMLAPYVRIFRKVALLIQRRFPSVRRALKSEQGPTSPSAPR